MYHELFHWRSSRHMKHLDLNSTQTDQEFLKKKKKEKHMIIKNETKT